MIPAKKRALLEQYGCAICAVQIAMADEPRPLQAASVGASGTLQSCALFGVHELIARLCPTHRAQFDEVCAKSTQEFGIAPDPTLLCPTCRAEDNPKLTIELAHLAGMAVGIFLASGVPTARAARAHVERHVCAEHFRDLQHGLQSMADALSAKKGNPS
ncbi:MAG TPA: hypothetical protein VMI75_38615 [Polyangiaceae bacterium]|nr:hypothetical protein [Polyangiaceae bacterium]